MIFLRKYKTYVKCYNISRKGRSLNHKIVINDVSMAKIKTVSYNDEITLVTKYIYENYDERTHFNTYRFHIKNSNSDTGIIPTLKIKINEVSQYYGKQYTDDHLVLRSGTINVAIRSINIDITHKRLKNFIKMICKKKEYDITSINSLIRERQIPEYPMG